MCHTLGIAVWHPVDMEAMLLREGRFSVIDVETTGLSPYDDAIVEVACLRIEGGVVVDRFVSLVDPGRSIPERASAVHGIFDDDVAGAPQIAALRATLLERTKGTAIVAHNARFDLGFLPFLTSRPVICSMRLAMHLVDSPTYRNEALRKLLGIRMSPTHGPAHRAYNDAAVTAAIFLDLLARYASRPFPQTVDGLIEQIARPAILGRFAFGKHRSKDLARIPSGYLRWITAAGFGGWPDVRATAEMEL